MRQDSDFAMSPMRILTVDPRIFGVALVSCFAWCHADSPSRQRCSRGRRVASERMRACIHSCTTVMANAGVPEGGHPGTPLRITANSYRSWVRPLARLPASTALPRSAYCTPFVEHDVARRFSRALQAASLIVMLWRLGSGKDRESPPRPPVRAPSANSGRAADAIC